MQFQLSRTSILSFAGLFWLVMACSRPSLAASTSFPGLLRLRQASYPTGADSLLTVSTTSGNFRGKQIGTVYEYLGIPYAKSTAGSARFKAPELASFSSETLDATDFGPACPQLVSNSSLEISAFTGTRPPPVSRQSEDCLSANVFVRDTTRAKAASLSNGKGGAAVLIWIFGGSFQYGTSSNHAYNPESFVSNQDDLIVVSFNYRTNIFGFPLSPQIKDMDASTGWNRGLQDRDLALQWVYQNIAQFGGDPNRITIFGESAGGMSVDTWAFANANNADPIVKGIIVQSGAVQGLDLALVDKSKDWTRPDSSWNRVANHTLVGCGVVNDAAQLSCMQTVPFNVLLDAMSSMGLSFGPSADNKLYFDDWHGRSSRRQFAKVPTLMGTNSDEGTLLAGLYKSDTAAARAQAAIITPLIFTCPAKQEAFDRFNAGVPTWRYVYSGNWENINSGKTVLGAYHFSEVPIVFRTYPAAYLSDPTRAVVVPPEQDQVAAWVQGAWAAFARNPTNGLTSYGWPRYSTWTKSLARIAKDNSATTTFEVPDPIDPSCNVAVPLKSTLYGLARQLSVIR